MRVKICHLTSAHAQEDIRIFHKECVSLASAGYEVYQISCGSTYEKNGVHLIGIGPKKGGRMTRMIDTAKAVHDEAVKLDADFYHIHDPELLPYALKLKKLGKKVIFDSHEDVPAQIMGKSYIPGPFRRIISVAYKLYETYVVKQLDAVVSATSHIADIFQGRCPRVVTVNNYPNMDEIVFHETPFSERSPIICYAGGISEIRGEKIMVEAMQGVNGTLVLAGDHECMTYERVNYIGRLDRNEVNELYGSSRAGIVIYQPSPNHTESQPIKLFEFMAAGLPMVASNFPLWREIVEGNSCGLCVDPTNPQEVKEACNRLLIHSEKGQVMGKRGRKAILEKYNWNNEKKTLCNLYKELEADLT